MTDFGPLRDAGTVLIWDLDGTIADTRTDITTAVSLVLASRGLEPLPLPTVIQHVGNGVHSLIAACLAESGHPEESEAELDLCVARFQEEYSHHLTDTTKAYEHLPQILNSLGRAERPMAVVSNKPERLSRELLRRLDLLHCFTIVYGGDSFSFRKPRPEPLLQALRICHPTDPAPHAVVIGDSHVDAEAARAAGLKFCAVAWGFTEADALRRLHPDWLFETPRELGEAFLSSL